MTRISLSFSTVLCAVMLLAACGTASTAVPTAAITNVATVPTIQPIIVAPNTSVPLTLTPTIAPTLAPTVVPTSPPTVAPTRPASSTLNSDDWTMYHRDSARTGYVPNMPDPQQLTAAWNTTLDGAVYAEPLVVGGHVLVATEGNSIYSLNMNTGQIEWRTQIGQPVQRSSLPCGNIDPLGITGTPVYDPATGLIFAVAEVAGPAHTLVGLDVKTGQVRVRRSADPDGMEPLAHQQRGALAIYRGMVYVAYGGLFGDCGNYHGWVVGARTDGSGPLIAYQVPTGREGGIWAPPGPVIDAAGRLFVSVGNGSEVTGDWDHSDSVLRLSADLKLEDGFAPDQWRQDNLMDADLGSLGPVLLSAGSGGVGDGLIFIAGKAGVGYLLHSDALGGVGGQALAKSVCHAYGGAAVVGSTAFIPCTDGLQQLQVGPGATFKLGWRADEVPGSPVVGGHTIYSLDGGGNLYALELETGKVRAKASVAPTSRFATPTLYQDHVLVGTMNGVAALTAR